ncbi:aminotransferase class V-fold PLP-dependent enzyme [Adhaeribacter aquaticus]|uniref:aminotransferase class V-fold PLP-dependent enzyme n=1 Tax=Adhaeribacter aquaticus TaxID=299567 RepID=UPI00041663FF|nr:aminotransferase class V-fold PLP-dependent enzyme [Adhaeribacter aquaticus]
MAVREERVNNNNAPTKEYYWESVRHQFNLSPTHLHLGASQFIASIPKPVRQAIEKHRRALDENPVIYTLDHENENMQEVRRAAARYLQADNPDNIAITDSTTMGLGLLYTALNVQPGQEILTSFNDHYSHHESIYWAAKRTGASYRKINLYKDLTYVSEEEIVESVVREIKEQTRVVGLTWVHSSTGLKIPIAKIGKAIAQINQNRDERNKIIFLVDGVHGFGIETDTFPELNCDFFISGCHKWLYGPRGTGIVVATSEAWQAVTPVIPSFTETMDMVIEEQKRPEKNSGKEMTPGGFHSLECRWALKEAFEFMETIGKKRVYARVHELNRYCKEGLAAMPHVKLHTPLQDHLSAGIISFEIKGKTTPEVVQALLDKKIIATASPYKTSYARFTPGIINTPEEIEKALAVVHDLH